MHIYPLEVTCAHFMLHGLLHLSKQRLNWWSARPIVNLVRVNLSGFNLRAARDDCHKYFLQKRRWNLLMWIPTFLCFITKPRANIFLDSSLQLAIDEMHTVRRRHLLEAALNSLHLPHFALAVWPSCFLEQNKLWQNNWFPRLFWREMFFV